MAALLTEISKAQMLLRIMEDIASARRVQFRIGDIDHDVCTYPGQHDLIVECKTTASGDVVWVVIDGTLRYCLDQQVTAGDLVKWRLHLPVRGRVIFKVQLDLDL